jgi:hypothetical protein
MKISSKKRWSKEEERQKARISSIEVNKRPDVKAKLHIARSGKNAWCAKSVNQYTKSGDFVANFETILDAAKATGVYYSHIAETCRRKRKSAGGFIWRDVNDVDQSVHFNSNKKYRKLVNWTAYKIVQLTKENTFVASYDNISLACDKTGICGQSISMCCRGLYKSAGGFLWKREEIK